MNSRTLPAETSSVESLLLELRAFTRPLHQALEQALDLTDPNLNLGAYEDILKIFLCYMRPWETAVGNALPVHLQSWFDARRRSQKLRLDLRALFIDPDALFDLAAPDIFVPGDTAQALGSMYVFEGSTLGAQTFVDDLAARLGLKVDAGLDFFSGYREHTGRMWRDFRQTLQREVELEDFASAVSAAGDTFKTFRSWVIAAKESKDALPKP